MKLWKPIVLILALSGCETTFTATKERIMSSPKFNQIVLEDVEQAILLAHETNDLISLKCWQYVKEFTLEHSFPAPGLSGKVVGVLSTYQYGRNIRRTVVDIKLSDKFRLECGPLLTDSVGALRRIGIKIAL